MQRPLLWLGVLALGGLLTLAAAGFMAWQLRLRYESQLTQQVWPARRTCEPVIIGPAQGRDKILLFGDSRMAAWDGLAPSDFTFVNAGQSGATTAQLQLLLPALLDEFRPVAIVIQAGVNDLKLVGLKPGLEPAIVSQAARNLSNIVAQSSAHGCRVLLLETWPVGKPEWRRLPVWNSNITLAVNHLNERLRQLHAPARGVQVVDIFNAAGVVPEPKLFRDALHFRPPVYQRLTPVLQAELIGLLRRTVTGELDVRKPE
jgi:lysophospholipase L1-like esterase